MHRPRVTGPVTPGFLGATPHGAHLAGPEHPVVVLVDSSDLGLEGLITHSPGRRGPGPAGPVDGRGDLDP